MIHFCAREVQKDGKPTGIYHYCCGDHPTGYCTRECTHSTPEEAQEHYKEYILDNLTFQSPNDEKAHGLYRCKECGKFTSGLAYFRYTMIKLCEDHLNRETAAKHIQIGESWES